MSKDLLELADSNLEPDEVSARLDRLINEKALQKSLISSGCVGIILSVISHSESIEVKTKILTFLAYVLENPKIDFSIIYKRGFPAAACSIISESNVMHDMNVFLEFIKEMIEMIIIISPETLDGQSRVHLSASCCTHLLDHVSRFVSPSSQSSNIDVRLKQVDMLSSLEFLMRSGTMNIALQRSPRLFDAFIGFTEHLQGFRDKPDSSVALCAKCFLDGIENGNILPRSVVCVKSSGKSSSETSDRNEGQKAQSKSILSRVGQWSRRGRSDDDDSGMRGVKKARAIQVGNKEGEDIYNASCVDEEALLKQ